ncbi:MAG: hypothetical protein A2V88_10510 [Elusimicrobia bacterium RBG_16_66_12]|nr:MAG: hypothetical protein A2V88_10510 [Elusimicrobia bacterium RBG_16_66_12]
MLSQGAATPEPPEENRRYRLLRLGLACNADCLFCNVPAESYPYPARLSTAEAEWEIDRMAAEGADRLELSGGEPSLRPDLDRLVAHARARGFSRVELQTNGLALAPRGRAEALRRAGLTHAFVALHSQLPRAHDGLLRMPGAWRDCVAAIENLIAAGVEVILNPVVTAVQYRAMAGYMRFVGAEFKIESVSLSVVQPHGRAEGAPSLVPRYRDLSPRIEAALDEADRLGLRVLNPFCGLPLCVGGWHRRLPRCVEWCEAELGHAPGDGMKTKPPLCASCALRTHCGGVWRRYLTIDPEPWLRPLGELHAS